jgi:general secretion pathway protein J
MRPGSGPRVVVPPGFTLLELLVAMAIFAIVGALAMGGLNAVLGQRELAARHLERLHQVQRAVRVMTNDFAQLNPRYVRDILGGEPANKRPLDTNCDEVTALACLSRGGWRNPFDTRPRGELQRVQYRFADAKLVREYWPAMDRILVAEPRSETLLDDLDGAEISYLDPSGSGDWLQQWPPVQQTNAVSGNFPAAVKITLRLKDWGEIYRYVEIAQ